MLGRERNDRASHGRHLWVREPQWLWTHPLGIQEEPRKTLSGVVVPPRQLRVNTAQDRHPPARNPVWSLTAPPSKA